MGIKQAIRSWLLADESILSTVSSAPIVSHTETRLPRIVFERIGTETTEIQSGEGGPDRDDIALMIYAETNDQLEILRALVKSRMRALSWDIVEGIRIARSYFGGGGEGYELKQGKEKPIYVSHLQFEIVWYELEE